MLLVLLQDGEELFELLVVDVVDAGSARRRLVEVAGQAGGVVGEEGAGAGDFGVDLWWLLGRCCWGWMGERGSLRGEVCCWLACIL